MRSVPINDMDNDSSEGWPGPERRTSLRLRRLIDELQGGVRDNRNAIETLAARVDDLATDIKTLKKERL